MKSNFEGNKKAKTIIYIIRYNILGAVGLLSASGGLAGQPEHAHTQATLSKIAYIQFTCVLIALITILLVLYIKHGQIKDRDMIVRNTLHAGLDFDRCKLTLRLVHQMGPDRLSYALHTYGIRLGQCVRSCRQSNPYIDLESSIWLRHCILSHGASS